MTIEYSTIEEMLTFDDDPFIDYELSEDDWLEDTTEEDDE